MYYYFQGCKGVILIIYVSLFGLMDLLLQFEVDMFKCIVSSDLYCLFCNCLLVVFNLGSLIDNSKEFLFCYEIFDINVLCCECGVKFELVNLLEYVFVDGKIICFLQVNLFVVLCDILFVNG